MTIQWYRSLADILGPLQLPAGISLGALPSGLTPTVRRWSSPDLPDSLDWPLLADRDTTTSSSPAAQWMWDTNPSWSPTELTQKAFEAVHLPGAPRDYHFNLLHAYSRLWDLRRQHPEGLGFLEPLCLLDIQLCEAAADVAREERGPHNGYLSVPAFGYLVNLYRDEGYIVEAIEIAETAHRFGGQGIDLEELQERRVSLESEDAHG